MQTNHRRLAAIMFTDMVGFSTLTQRNEPLALELLEVHNTLIRPLLQRHHGTEIKTIGDSFMVEFASALSAVRCAIAVQERLNNHNASQPGERKIHIRIGIHLGDVEHREGDVFGNGVNIASRIEPLAEAGGICISRQVYDQVHHQLEQPLKSIGKRELKNIHTPVEVYKVTLPWHDESKESQARTFTANTVGVVAITTTTVISLAVFGWWISTLFTKPYTPAPQPISSLAVLPFDNLSSDEENEYFSDGIAEDILNALANVDGLSVRGRTSSFLFKGSALAIPEIAKQLNVEAILAGSVRKIGNQVRITAQLIRASDDTYLWSEQFDRLLVDVFAIQEEIATIVLNRLQIQGDRPAHLVKTGTDNIEAYNLYLQGRYNWNESTFESHITAAKQFESATEADPNFALAYAWLADTYTRLHGWDVLSHTESLALATVAAQKSLTLDENLAYGHIALGLIQLLLFSDLEQSFNAYQRALELDPKDANILRLNAGMLSYLGKNDEALLLYEQAIQLDPLNLRARSDAGYAYALAGKHEKAQAQFTTLIDLYPNLNFGHWGLINLEIQQQGWQATENLIVAFINENPGHHGLHTMYARYLLAVGRNEQAVLEIRNAIQYGSTDLVTLGGLARVGRDYDLAEKLFSQNLEQYPQSGETLVDLASVYLDTGRVAEGVEADLLSWTFESGLPEDKTTKLRETFETLGLQAYLAELNNALSQLVGDPCWGRFEEPDAAAHQARANNVEEALACFERIYRLRVDPLSWALFLKAPEYDKFQSDPKYLALLDQLGLNP